VSAGNGARNVVWQQQVAGLTVFNSLLIGHITRDGEPFPPGAIPLVDSRGHCRRFGRPRGSFNSNNFAPVFKQIRFTNFI
jgi:hypothetical protein